jgi:hypothetical protein
MPVLMVGGKGGGRRDDWGGKFPAERSPDVVLAFPQDCPCFLFQHQATIPLNLSDHKLIQMCFRPVFKATHLASREGEGSVGSHRLNSRRWPGGEGEGRGGVSPQPAIWMPLESRGKP